MAGAGSEEAVRASGQAMACLNQDRYLDFQSRTLERVGKLRL